VMWREHPWVSQPVYRHTRACQQRQVGRLWPWHVGYLWWVGAGRCSTASREPGERA